jgi:lysophospholipase L1-like esterase
MGRARRARRIAATAAYGGGGAAAAVGALGALGYAIIRTEAAIARKIVGRPFDGAPDDDGVYGHGVGEPIELVMLGDSSAAGMGADSRYQTVGAIISTGVSALTGRPVRLTNEAVIGAESGDLEVQLANALDRVPDPDAVVIMVGANDVTHRIERSAAVRHLEQVVRRLRAIPCEVIVGTCPDLGTIEPVPQPLRLLMRRWSRDLAAAQTVAVVEGGGRTVSLGDLLGAEFSARPHVMFSQDRFHPSPAGYARAAAALLPTVCAALGIWALDSHHRPAMDSQDRPPEPQRGEGFGPVAVAAGQAVREPGTEVSAMEIAGQVRGPRGRWAVLRRRRRSPIPPTEEAREPADAGRAQSSGRSRAGSGGVDSESASGRSLDGMSRSDVASTRTGPTHTEPAETSAAGTGAADVSGAEGKGTSQPRPDEA